MGLMDRAKREHLKAGFEDVYCSILEEKGRFRANLWYRSHVVTSLFPILIRRIGWSCAMLKNILKITLRNIKRQKIYSFINIAGLALGMACCLLILVWVQDELSFDRFHTNADRLYRVVTEQHRSGIVTVTAETQYPLAPGLKADIPEVENSCRLFTKWGDMTIRAGDRYFTETRVLFADRSFFLLFTFPLSAGDSESALGDPYSIVLTQDLADTYFPGEDAVGQTLGVVYRGHLIDLSVTGVMEPVPENSHLRFDLLLSFSIFDELYTMREELWQTADNYQTYVLLHEGVPEAAAAGNIVDYKAKHIAQCEDRLLLQPVPSIHLHSHVKFDSPTNGSIQTVHFFLIVAGVILLIACINFMNLATARSARRAKEVGLRKVVGAPRRQIVRQFFGESLLLTTTALLIALVVIQLALPGFNALSGKQLSLVNYRNASIFLFLVGIAVVTGLVAGSYPAFYLSAFQPAAVLKGDAANRTAHLKGARFRRLLVVVQFFLSISLIICTLVVSNQLRFLRTKDIGYDRDNLIMIPVRGSARTHYPSLKQEFLKHPNIRGVSGANIMPAQLNESTLGEWEGNAAGDEIIVSITSVDYDYFEAMGMEIAQGRAFSPAFPADLEDAVVVNEEAVRQMGMEDPVGKRIWRGRRIIGVVRDFHFTSLHDRIEPIVLSLTDWNVRHIFVNIGSDVPGTLAYVREVYDDFVKDFPFEFRFMDDVLDGFYRTEERVQTLFGTFTAMAIVIASMGLFGLASFTAERRTKEIGVRKVLGATAGSIVGMLTREYARVVLISNILAWPAAFFVMRAWLQGFAYRTSLSAVTFVLAALVSLGVALVTVSVQSLRAALGDPVEALRFE